MHCAHKKRCPFEWLMLACVFANASMLPAQETSALTTVQGFLEPYRTVRVASVESGVLKRLFVQEGDRVEEDQPVAELDTSIQKAMLEIAKANRDARGEIDLARAEHRLRQQRLDLLLQLHADSHASDEETRRARTELEVAAAQVRSAEERQLGRKLEFERLAAQLEARTIRAPQDGVVTTLHKQSGEYVGPTEPAVLTIVQLQPLLAVFLVPREQATRLNVGQSVSLQLPAANRDMEGTIEVIAPVVDAGSGTVTVRVRVDNADRSLRAGEPCLLAPNGGLRAAASGAQRLRLPMPRLGEPRKQSPTSNPFRSTTAKR
jgi:RND family efflux transporter MFP subunit